MLKIHFITRNDYGFCMHLLEKYIKKYAPQGIEFTDFDKCDITFEHIFGDHKTIKAKDCFEIMNRISKKPYAVFFNGFGVPKEHIKEHTFFEECFKNARLVYSPWDLMGLYGYDLNNFIRGPWGADPEIFYKVNKGHRYYHIFATGYVSATECIQEIYEACKILDIKMLHSGHNFHFDSGVYHHQENLDSYQMAFAYNNSRYSSGLRRAEGFEMVVPEAIFCGTKPICFDNPHYTYWFKDWAVFIPEVDYEPTRDSLVKLLFKDPDPLRDEEIVKAKKIFSWEVICKKFWEGLLKNV